MAEPQAPSKEDEDDETVYPDTQDINEQRRAYVLDKLTQCGDAPSIDGKVFVGNLDLILRWLETGAVPDEKQKRKLQTVPA